MTEWVTVKHEKTGATAEVTQKALDKVYAEKGWKKVDEKSDQPAQEQQGQSAQHRR